RGRDLLDDTERNRLRDEGAREETGRVTMASNGSHGWKEGDIVVWRGQPRVVFASYSEQLHLQNGSGVIGVDIEDLDLEKASLLTRVIWLFRVNRLSLELFTYNRTFGPMGLVDVWAARLPERIAQEDVGDCIEQLNGQLAR